VYWDKQAMAAGPTLSNATITNWMLAVDIPGGHGWARNVPHSIKRPLESRIWYRYPDQLAPATHHHTHGVGRSPALIGRVLEGGVSQVTTLTYNSQERVTSRMDPVGRQTHYTYASNERDLLSVEQVRSGGTDVLQTLADYTSTHRPQTITGAAGQTTTLTYNAAGQSHRRADRRCDDARRVRQLESADHSGAEWADGDCRGPE
jgi:YD repeat-containing protein